jgi:LacI family transcriptional regulator
LITFNDMAMTRHMTPPLTVISYDTAQMGRLGAKTLVELIESDSDLVVTNVVMPEKLMLRSTTAPPAVR